MLDRNERFAAALAERLAAFAPHAVVYVATGGERLGRAIAVRLGVPAQGIAVCYPSSPYWNRVPAPLRIVLWPLKELLYRATLPVLSAPAPSDLAGRRVVLVDDTASSGRTLAVAIDALGRAGVPRSALSVAVIRCGESARALVDHRIFPREAGT